VKIRLIDKSPGDYLEVGIRFPEISYDSNINPLLRDVQKRFIVSFDTTLLYSFSSDYKYARFQILGFGVYFIRQTGY
jgi:hypothetical protein